MNCWEDGRVRMWTNLRGESRKEITEGRNGGWPIQTYSDLLEKVKKERERIDRRE